MNNYKIINSNFLLTDKQGHSHHELIDLIESKHYKEAQLLISKSIIENHNFFTRKNIFNYLLIKINTHKDLFYIDLFLETIKNDTFIFNSENIRNCVRLLPNNFIYHKLILQKIHEQNTIKNLSIQEKTDLLLMLSEYYYHKNTKSNYKKYLSLLSEVEIIECQNYFVNNFDTYFNNVYSNIPVTTEISSKVTQFKMDVLIHKTYSDNNEKIPKQPKQSDFLLGEDIKYINMITPLWDFYKRQKKVKYGYSCLFENPKNFFVFFSKYIKPHKPCDINNEIISFLKEINNKYKLASITWDNRYFYERNLNILKKNIETSIKKTLQLFNLKSLNTIHLQFKSPETWIYDGVYNNLFNSEIKKNIHVITMNSQGFYNYQSTFIHEVSHFIHFQSNNKKCFKTMLFLKIKDKIYLHKERKYILEKLNNIKNKKILPKLILFFDNYLHYSLKRFMNSLESLLNKNMIEQSDRDFILSLFLEYKKYKYKKSEQYFLWEDYAIKEKINPMYFNQNHEIHARLNEILSNYEPIISKNLQYLTEKSVPFNTIKDDLIKFNNLLIKNMYK